GALVGTGLQLAVGAPGTSVLDRDGAGVVHLYGADSVLRRTIEAFDPAADAGFGTKVAAADGVLYVSAPGDPPTGGGAMGAVYEFDATTGVLPARFAHLAKTPARHPSAVGPAFPAVPSVVPVSRRVRRPSPRRRGSASP